MTLRYFSVRLRYVFGTSSVLHAALSAESLENFSVRKRARRLSQPELFALLSRVRTNASIGQLRVLPPWKVRSLRPQLQRVYVPRPHTKGEDAAWLSAFRPRPRSLSAPRLWVEASDTSKNVYAGVTRECEAVDAWARLAGSACRPRCSFARARSAHVVGGRRFSRAPRARNDITSYAMATIGFRGYPAVS